MKDLVVVDAVPVLSSAVSALERIFIIPLLLPLNRQCTDPVLGHLSILDSPDFAIVIPV